MLVRQETRARDSLAPSEMERMIYHKQLNKKNSVCQQRAIGRTSGKSRDIELIMMVMTLDSKIILPVLKVSFT